MNDIPDICILLNSRIGRLFAVGDVGVSFTVWGSCVAFLLYVMFYGMSLFKLARI